LHWKKKRRKKDKNNKILYTTPSLEFGCSLLSFVSFGVWTLEFVMGFPAEAISYKILPFRAGQNNKETNPK
jgi:hypothetical protein